MSDGGYYTVKIADNLRVIVLNSQLGYVFNFYTFLKNQTQLQDMFDWADSVLTAAAGNNEHVLITGHISASARFVVV